MIDIFIANLQDCNGKCVVILPDIMGLWFPKYKKAEEKAQGWLKATLAGS